MYPRMQPIEMFARKPSVNALHCDHITMRAMLFKLRDTAVTKSPFHQIIS